MAPSWFTASAEPASGRIVLGGRFGEEPEVDTCRRLDAFIDAGGRLVDTAHSYADGESERVLGRWISTRGRGCLVLVDKVCHPRDGLADARPSTIRAEIDLSLQRLGADHVDVIMLHRDDPKVPVEDIAAALAHEVERGRARWIGVSNWPMNRLRTFLNVVGTVVDTPVVSYQRSLAVPAHEIWPGALAVTDSVATALSRAGVPLLAWAAQARGWFARSEDPAAEKPFRTSRNIELRRIATEIGRAHKVPATVVALSWLLRHPLTWPIVGPRNHTELMASLDATRLHLTDDEVRALGHARGAGGNQEPPHWAGIGRRVQ